MSKILAKTVKKGMLLTVIITVITVASIVIGAIFGFNGLISDNKSLTVAIRGGVAYETRLDDLQAECEKEFGDLKAKYVVKGEVSGVPSELVFVFNKKADLSEAQKALEAKFEIEDVTTINAKWSGVEIKVSSASEEVVGVMPHLYILRTAIACVVFAGLVFGYATLRYKWQIGAVAGIATAVSMALTTAIVVLTRVLVTPAFAYTVAVSGLLTAVLVLFGAHKVKTAVKEGEAEGKSVEELVVSSIPVKEILIASAGLGIAVLLVGILGQTVSAWFAVSALIGILVSAFIGLAFAPAIYLPLKVWSDARPAKNGYKGAKKAVNEVEKKEEVAEDDED